MALSGIHVDTGTAGVGAITGISVLGRSLHALQTITVGSGYALGDTRCWRSCQQQRCRGRELGYGRRIQLRWPELSFTVQNLAILVPNGAATSVTNVTVSYKDVNGATQTADTAARGDAATAVRDGNLHGPHDVRPCERFV